MKKPYEKPMLAVEYYSLTQSVAHCNAIKISAVSSQCVLNDPDSTNEMRNWAYRNGFISGSCNIDMSGYKSDTICYHTSTNAAFTS